MRNVNRAMISLRIIFAISCSLSERVILLEERSAFFDGLRAYFIDIEIVYFHPEHLFLQPRAITLRTGDEIDVLFKSLLFPEFCPFFVMLKLRDDSFKGFFYKLSLRAMIDKELDFLTL